MTATILPDDLKSFDDAQFGVPPEARFRPRPNLLTGVSTSSTTDDKGPLADAYQNPFESVVSLQYPRDLHSSRKGHSVSFSMFETFAVTGQEIKETIKDYGAEARDAFINQATKVRDLAVQKIARNSNEMGTNSAGQFANDTFNEVVSAENEKFEAVNANDAFGKITRGEYTSKTFKGFGTRTRNIHSASVNLYMPETVQFEYTSQYENFTLADAIGSAHVPLVSAAARAITSTLDKGGNTAARALLNYAGYVFNPQQQMMFEGIDFRNYAMSFTFTPFSKEETETVKKIIRTFREHAAPTIVRSLAGFFFNPPSVFQIKYLHNGSENEYLPKLKKCVLEQVSVDYSPNGWSAFGDGSPTQITMTLAFREVELVDRVDIQNGY